MARQSAEPIGSWTVAWTSACKLAGVACLWHDMRHSFVSRMAEGQVSDATIMALSAHLSHKMLERYSHVRGEAKRKPIAMLDFARDPEGGHNLRNVAPLTRHI